MVKSNNLVGVVIKKIGLSILAILLLAACGEDDSSTIESNRVQTADIYPNIRITATNNVAYVEAELLNGGPGSTEYIVLSGSDELWLSNGSSFDDITVDGDLFSALKQQTDKLIRFRREEGRGKFSDFFGTLGGVAVGFINLLFDGGSDDSWYSGEFVASFGDEIWVSLLRASASLEDSTSTRVTIPDSFTITAPVSNEVFSRSGSSIVVNWQPISSTANVDIVLNAICEDETQDSFSQTDLPDKGSYVLPAGTFSSLNGSCSLVIKVVKRQTGTIDAQFTLGGRIEALLFDRVVVETID